MKNLLSLLLLTVVFTHGCELVPRVTPDECTEECTVKDMKVYCTDISTGIREQLRRIKVPE